MLPCNTGALSSYFRDSPKWHQVSAADARGRAVDYRDAPGRTVAPPGLHRECIVANRSITGTTVITVCPKLGLVRSTAENVWTHSNFFTIRPASLRSAGYKLPGSTGTYTGTVWTRLAPCYIIVKSYFSGPHGSWSVHVCCLNFKMEFRSCARGVSGVASFIITDEQLQ